MLRLEDFVAAWSHSTHEGSLSHATNHGEGHGTVCGDVAEIDLNIKDGHIVEARWSCAGCVMTKGVCEVLCSWIIGLTPDEARLVYIPTDRLKPTRIGCYMLPFDTLQDALNVQRP